MRYSKYCWCQQTISEQVRGFFVPFRLPSSLNSIPSVSLSFLPCILPFFPSFFLFSFVFSSVLPTFRFSLTFVFLSYFLSICLSVCLCLPSVGVYLCVSVYSLSVCLCVCRCLCVCLSTLCLSFVPLLSFFPPLKPKPNQSSYRLKKKNVKSKNSTLYCI